MNVFVLCTGRCGSTTFIEACRHATNYTAAHESRAGHVGASRLSYPPNHIEADNRLSWFLGRLEKAYGDEAFYVHLRRDDLATAQSFVRRYDSGIIRAYREVVLLGSPKKADPLRLCLDYCETVNANIELFLKDKTKQARVSLENAKEDFGRFWEWVGAEGDLRAALAEWDVKYNASGTGARAGGSILRRLAHRARRAAGHGRP